MCKLKVKLRVLKSRGRKSICVAYLKACEFQVNLTYKAIKFRLTGTAILIERYICGVYGMVSKNL
jgi:hypothetical protein